MSTATYVVQGMTCQHCKLSVTDEVSEVPGVEHVGVDLDSGRVEVTGTGYSDRAIASAVEQAGYELAPTTTSRA